MQCPRCSRPMTLLFLSYACDYCDGLVPDDDWDRGYVVWRGRALPAEEYVFATREDAEQWRTISGENGTVRPVRAPVKFRWRKSSGTVKDLTMADRLVTIYPDRRFPPAPYRAMIGS